MNPELREGSLKDVVRVVSIEKRCFSSPWSPATLAIMLTSSRIGSIVAEIDQRGVVGYAFWQRVLDEAHLLNIAVDPEFRRRGIARRLLEKMIQICKDDGVMVIQLEVRKSNIPAIELYRSLGFVEVGVRKGYYEDNGEDALLMDLYLDRWSS